MRTAAAYMPTGRQQRPGVRWPGLGRVVPGARQAQEHPEHVDQPHGQVLMGAEEEGGDLADQPHQPTGGEQQRRHHQPEHVRDVLVLAVGVAVTPHRVASSPASAGTGRLGLAQADAAAALAVRGVVGVLGREAMAALAVGLAGLGMAGGDPAVMGATGSLQGDQAADDLLGLAAPDPVLLAGPDREGQAGVAHRARLADGDSLGLESLASEKNGS